MVLRSVLRILIFCAMAAAAWLLFLTLRQYTLAQIGEAMAALPLGKLAFSLGFAACSYVCLSFFDALGARYAGKPLPLRRTALTSFVSLSIGHNVGVAALSSGAIRYRYYSRWGLGPGEVALIVLFCGFTVALGLSTLGAAALFLRPQDAMNLTGLGRGAILALAIAASCFPLAYVALSALTRRAFTIRGHKVALPAPRIALLQVAIGSLNFAFVAASLHQVLSAFSEASYPKVAAISIIANVAAIVSHVPGGIGVLEATVAHIFPGVEALAAVIAFRVIYYFIPLGFGLLIFAASELRRFRKTAPSAARRNA